ncbi:hypothetical protein L198_06760 [Cryptococcus wingfieldii CBS 7118]|uniref:CUE domain-containing protein n=1 Tax=Cryptococcus wingfieldii CBS 7118 TaxID=1295528 RepID=A0A1E3IIY2_9TREE|nr:hypothetical protein L198_06760 [Cryptococcus wingfieldii CBS 7118]ODN88488.1 hypothetical protein L198_06760 [Cryptococcus wingfieldii CBS 7118]
MATRLPAKPPPPAIFPKLLPLLISRLTTQPVDIALIPSIETAFYILRVLTLYPDVVQGVPSASAKSLVPLQKLLEISTSHPSSIKPPLVLDAIIAYPIHSPVVRQVVSNVIANSPDVIEVYRIDVLPDLVDRCRKGSQKQVLLAVNLLLGIMRVHDELLALILEASEDILKGLSVAYAKLAEDSQGVVPDEAIFSGRDDILVICRELLVRVGLEGSASEAMFRFMDGGQGGMEAVLEGRSLRKDCEKFVSKDQGAFNPSSWVVASLNRRRDELAKKDARVASILALFPTIPAHLLLAALSHPQFSSIPSGSRTSPGELAEPLLECLLNGGQGLPAELSHLKELASKLGYLQASADAPEEVPQPKKKFERRNIFSAEDLDMSRLRIKNDETALPELQSTIPSHLRDSIQRLIALQIDEEEERRQALAGANLLPSDDESDLDESGEIPLRVKVSGGDSEDTAPIDSDGDAVKVKQQKQSGNRLPDREVHMVLRGLYLDDPGLFDRDGATRRSDQRNKLKERTGWDDGQIEGWKVMLERDPNKDTILEAHRDSVGRNFRAPSPTLSTTSNQTQGSNRGRRPNKGNRGHSNAARTRGHDRKMRQMGA